MRSLLLAAAAIALVACGAASSSAVAPSTSSAPRAATTPLPTSPINVDDMMGLYAQQTVFVADVEKVSVITLLNHFTRHTIPTRSKAQVASAAYATFGTPPANAPVLFFVLDGLETGSGPIRLRTMDLLNGTEIASRSDIGSVASTHRALGAAIDGRALVLKQDARHAWIDAYEAITLKPLGTVAEKAGCGDRILTSGSRVAIVCLATGQIAVDELHGGGTALVDGTLPALAGATMSEDGTIYAVTTDRKLAVVSPGATKLSPLPWPSEWSGTVLPDTLAVAWGTNYATVMLAQLNEDGAWLRELASNNVQQRQSLRLAGRTSGAPQFGLVVLAPFAYFASGGSVKHVELNSGMLETMTEVGQGATVVAVVNR